MQITIWPKYLYLKSGNSTEPVGEGWMIKIRHAVVRNNHSLTSQFVLTLFQEILEMGAADLLLTFDDEGEIAGEFSAGLELRFDRFKVSKMLTFVIRRSPCKQRIFG